PAADRADRKHRAGLRDAARGRARTVVGRGAPDLAGPRRRARCAGGGVTAEDSTRTGRADLHIHTLASDGTSSVPEILAHVAAEGPIPRRLLASDDPGVRPDTIETFNPTAFGRYRHRTVVAFAEQHGLAQLGNSDAHEAAAIGTCWTTFPGRTPDDLRAAIAA